MGAKKKKKNKFKNNSVKSSRNVFINKEKEQKFISNVELPRLKTTENVKIEENNKQSVANKIKEINVKLKDKSLSSEEVFDLISLKKKLSKELAAIRKKEKELALKTSQENTIIDLTSKELKLSNEKEEQPKEVELSSKEEKPKVVEPPRKKENYKKKQTSSYKKKGTTKKKSKQVIKPTPVVPTDIELPKLKEEVPDIPVKEEVLEEQSVEIVEEQSKEVTGVSSEEKIKYTKKFKCGIITLIVIIPLVFGIFLGLFISFFVINKSDNKVSLMELKADIYDQEKLEEENRLASLYSECLARNVDDRDRTEEIINAEQELSKYLTKYKTSVAYKDFDLGFTYLYNQNAVYYAASSVKMLAGLYIYTEAAKGNINLDATIKYTAKDKWSASKEMSKKKYNSLIKIRDLVKYTITVSDNTAYQMLVKYIGRSKLKSFGIGLGAKYTLSGYDNFGSINVSDGLIYWKAVYDFVNSNEELGKELLNYMKAAEQNDIALPDLGIEAAHKYGEYRPSYHDLGIVFAEHPYEVAILTREYGKSMEDKIKDINKHIYELHNKYYENRVNLCEVEVYGQKNVTD